MQLKPQGTVISSGFTGGDTCLKRRRFRLALAAVFCLVLAVSVILPARETAAVGSSIRLGDHHAAPVYTQDYNQDYTQDYTQADPTQPQIGPGIPQVGSNAPRSASGSTKPGSILFFHKFTSDSKKPESVNTLITLTNTNPRDTIAVRLFYVSNCSVIDRFLTLAANESHSMLASIEAPDKTGYVVAVAVGSTGLPAQFNWLIGSANYLDAKGHEAGYNAYGVAKRSGGQAVSNDGGKSADIVFDGVDYDRLPQVIAIDHLRNQSSLYSPTAVTDISVFSPLTRLGGPLIDSDGPVKVTATVYDSNGVPSSQDVPANCGINGGIDQVLTSPPFNTQIVSNRAGWATFSASGQSGPAPTLGLSLTDLVDASLHNARVMQTLEWLDSFKIVFYPKLPDYPVADVATQNLPEAKANAQGASESKAGSILFFPRFTGGNQGTTQIFLTNTHSSSSTRVRVLFSGLAEPAEIKETIVTLHARRTMMIDADAVSPNQRGWVMAMAVDNGATPIQFNHLIGSAQVREFGGPSASFNAVAVARNSSAPVTRPASGDDDLESAEILFNDEEYDRLPIMTAMAFVPSQIDNDTQLGFSRMPSSLLDPPNTRGTASATLYDQLLAPLGANVPKVENHLGQLRNTATQQPLTTSIAAGDHGWLKFYANVPSISWSLNNAPLGFRVDANGAWRGGVNGDGNLHILTTADSFTLKVPANNPNNHIPVAVADTLGVQVEARRPNGTIVRIDGSASTDQDADDPLTYEWIDGGQSISKARIADRILSVGSHDISLIVTDGSGAKSLPAEQTVTVVDTTPPQISGLPSSVTKVTDSLNGEPVSFSLPIAYDMIDGAVPVFASKLPGSMFPLGKSVVTFTAQDRSGNTSTAQIEVTVNYGPAQPQTGGGAGDKAPLMDNINDEYIKAGEVREMTVVAVDPDGDYLRFSLQGAPDYAQIFNGSPDSRSAVLRIAPPANETGGANNVRIVVSDGKGQSFTTLPFRIWISEVPNDETGSGASLNRAPIPVIADLPVVVQATDMAGIEVVLDATKSIDPDGDKLSFQWFDGETLIAKTALARVQLDVGAHVFKVAVYDGKDGLSVSDPVTVIVLPRDLTVTGISPSRLWRSTTETLTIVGTGFSPATEIRFTKLGVAIKSYVSIEEDKIVLSVVVASDAIPGFRDVYLTNPNGKSLRVRSGLFVNP